VFFLAIAPVTTVTIIVAGALDIVSKRIAEDDEKTGAEKRQTLSKASANSG